MQEQSGREEVRVPRQEVGGGPRAARGGVFSRGQGGDVCQISAKANLWEAFVIKALPLHRPIGKGPSVWSWCSQSPGCSVRPEPAERALISAPHVGTFPQPGTLVPGTIYIALDGGGAWSQGREMETTVSCTYLMFYLF